MSLFSSYDRTKFLGEVNTPLETQGSGVMTTAQQVAAILANLAGTAMSQTDLSQVAGITAGQAAANKAVVLDGTKSIGTLGNVFAGNLSASGTVRSTGGTIGYGGGAGGAVTQITSRTTGVTLNKASGQITLFAAAPSTTPTSFTLTNSSITALDMVTVSVASANAANIYVVSVTAVGAGTAQISVYAQAGTTSDSPVLNFAVVKGSIT